MDSSRLRNERQYDVIFADLERFLRDSYLEQRGELLPQDITFERVLVLEFQQPDGYECSLYSMAFLDAVAKRRTHEFRGLEIKTVTVRSLARRVAVGAIKKRFDLLLLFGKLRAAMKEAEREAAREAGRRQPLIELDDE